MKTTAAALLFGSSVCFAQNLVTNSDFDNDVGGWVVDNNDAVLSLDTFNGDPIPPSAYVSQSGPADVISNCILFASTAAVDFSANMKLNFSAAEMMLNAYLSEDCTGPFSTAAHFTQIDLPTPRWMTHSVNDFVLPVGTRSVQVDLQVNFGVLVNFDHVYFGLSRQTPVKLVQFQVD